ncbi:hypothetical protein N2152v2_001960 [Parachlorella kessleri]
MTNLFEPAALFIMFREALEAAVIVAVMLQLLNKLNMRHLKRYVWIGAGVGLLIAIIIGVVFCVIFYVANNKIFSGDGELIFKGVISWIACLMITIVAFAMLKFYNLERKWRHKLESAQREAFKTNRSHKWTMMLLAGSATLREGVEAVLFLTGVSQGEGVKSLIIPGIVGLILGILVGVIIFYSGKPIKSLKWFFYLSCGLLLLIAAGLVVTGTGYFQAAGIFGPLYPYEDRPWCNEIIWDTSGCCSSTDNKFWEIIKALFGYTDQPTNLQLLYYCLYWFIVVMLLVFKWWTGNLTDRRKAELAELKSMKLKSVSSGKLGKELGDEEDLETGNQSATNKTGVDVEDSGLSSPKDSNSSDGGAAPTRPAPLPEASPLV